MNEKILHNGPVPVKGVKTMGLLILLLFLKIFIMHYIWKADKPIIIGKKRYESMRTKKNEMRNGGTKRNNNGRK